jgi:hypothetical protein
MDPGMFVLPQRLVDLRYEIPGLRWRPPAVRGIYPYVTGGQGWTCDQILLLILR